MVPIEHLLKYNIIAKNEFYNKIVIKLIFNIITLNIVYGYFIAFGSKLNFLKQLIAIII